MAKRERITFDPASWGAPGPDDLRRPPETPEERERAFREAGHALAPGALLVPIITLLICIPLALGRIGPNGFYGFRTQAAFASEEAWYAINIAAGRAGAGAAVVALCVIALILRSRTGTPLARGMVAFLVGLAPILASIAVATG